MSLELSLILNIHLHAIKAHLNTVVFFHYSQYQQLSTLLPCTITEKHRIGGKMYRVNQLVEVGTVNGRAEEENGALLSVDQCHIGSMWRFTHRWLNASGQDKLHQCRPTVFSIYSAHMETSRTNQPAMSPCHIHAVFHTDKCQVVSLCFSHKITLIVL